MQTVKTINEFMVRWSDDGSAIQGMHVAEREAFRDDAGVEVTSRMLPPRAVQSTDAAALEAVAASINAASLAQFQQAQAAVATLTTARDAALADAKALREKYEAPAIVNGVPQFVKKWQLLAGLRKDGMYAGVMAYINALPPAAKDLWDGSQGIERTSPFIPAFKAQFGLTDAVVDGMFQRYAAMTQADVLALE